MYCLVAIFTYPLQMYPVRRITERILFAKENQASLALQRTVNPNPKDVEVLAVKGASSLRHHTTAHHV